MVLFSPTNYQCFLCFKRLPAPPPKKKSLRNAAIAEGSFQDLFNTQEHENTPLFINLGASLEVAHGVSQHFLSAQMKGCRLFSSEGEPGEDRNIRDDKAVHTH